VTLFLGGWRGPVYPHVIHWFWPLLWFVLKLLLVIYGYVLVRATLPRMRYDRLMNFGWRVLIPFGLIWVLATGAVVELPQVYSRRQVFEVGAAVLGVVLLLSLLAPLFTPKRPQEVSS
jgi:NADH-quinone oxidoreductase subunit H